MKPTFFFGLLALSLSAAAYPQKLRYCVDNKTGYSFSSSLITAPGIGNTEAVGVVYLNNVAIEKVGCFYSEMDQSVQCGSPHYSYWLHGRGQLNTLTLRRNERFLGSLKCRSNRDSNSNDWN